MLLELGKRPRPRSISLKCISEVGGQLLRESIQDLTLICYCALRDTVRSYPNCEVVPSRLCDIQSEDMNSFVAGLGGRGNRFIRVPNNPTARCISKASRYPSLRQYGRFVDMGSIKRARASPNDRPLWMHPGLSSVVFGRLCIL